MAKTEWYIPDMYLPTVSNGDYASHEAVCVLNAGDVDCEIQITLYFEDREPVICERQVCPAKRTVHIRTDLLKLADGGLIQRGVGYAGLVRCSVPAVVQYTRVDTTQAKLTMMTSMGY